MSGEAMVVTYTQMVTSMRVIGTETFKTEQVPTIMQMEIFIRGIG